MSDYPGRIISATAPTVSTISASGVWTLEEALQYQQSGTWPIAVGPVVGDPNFNQTVLLLHGDGTNGAQNNTFLDGSTNNFTITRNGNTTQGTFSPFSVGAGEWSNYFDGSGDYLTANPTALGSGNFTIEGFVYLTSSSINSKGIFHLATSTPLPSSVTGVALSTGASGGWNLYYNNGSQNTSNTLTAVPNTWIHFAVVKESTQIRVYINGILNQSQTDTATYTNTATAIGGWYSTSLLMTGYVSNFRIVASALYSGTSTSVANFSIPTAPLTAISNTNFLTCQSNRFVDNSTNAFAITRNGDVKVTPFSPFAPSAAYDPAVNGGSGYFDGTGDYLSIASATALNLSTGAFTLEGWIYPSANVVHLFSRRSAATARGLILAYGNVTNNKFSFLAGDTSTGAWEVNITSTDTFAFNAWYHVAITRDSSNNFTLWVNGTSQATTNSNVTIADDASNLLIGGIDNTGSMNGYLSNLRLVKGRAVYTSAFTPPTSPVGTTSGGSDPPQGTETGLLCNFTNAGIFDNTGKNNLETVGNAQIDTTTKKFGTGSMEFDGTGDWLLMPNNPDQQLGTGNFTIEFWVYLASGDTGSNRGLVAKGGASTGWLVSLNTTEKVVFTYTTSTITSTGSITTNAWNHIAVVREGTGSNQTKIYIGGTNDGTGTVSTAFTQTESMYVGANRTGGDPMKGFIDDLRITKGVARYTSNFTPPAASFQDQ